MYTMLVLFVLLSVTSALPVNESSEYPVDPEKHEELQLEFEINLAIDPLKHCSYQSNYDFHDELLVYKPYFNESGQGYYYRHWVPDTFFQLEMGKLKNNGTDDELLEIRGYFISTRWKIDENDFHRVHNVTHYLVNENGYLAEGEHIPGSQGKVPDKLTVQELPCPPAASPGLCFAEACSVGK